MKGNIVKGGGDTKDCHGLYEGTRDASAVRASRSRLAQIAQITDTLIVLRNT